MRTIEESVLTASANLPSQDYLLNVASGSTVTLPAATGSGFKYKFMVGTTITSNDYIIQAASADDIMQGLILGAADGGNTVNGWEAAATSDTITLNGSTKGGLIGDVIELVDAKEGVWIVSGAIAQTGTEATPFSAAV